MERQLIEEKKDPKIDDADSDMDSEVGDLNEQLSSEQSSSDESIFEYDDEEVIQDDKSSKGSQ